MILLRTVRRLLMALLLFVAVYLLSYPPFLLYQYGYCRPVFTNAHCCAMVDMNDPCVAVHTHTLFVPVEHLIDSTVLHKPMLLLAKCFGSADKMRYDSIIRRLSRRLDIPIKRKGFIRRSDYTNISIDTWASLKEARK